MRIPFSEVLLPDAHPKRRQQLSSSRKVLLFPEGIRRCTQAFTDHSNGRQLQVDKEPLDVDDSGTWKSAAGRLRRILTVEHYQAVGIYEGQVSQFLSKEVICLVREPLTCQTIHHDLDNMPAWLTKQLAAFPQSLKIFGSKRPGQKGVFYL